jgi:predicted nucleic acid-binding protein
MDVVLDTTDLLPALVSRGRRRACLSLCRYGRASLVHLTYGGVGFDSLAEFGEPAGPLADVLEGAENEIAFLEERLPAGAPNDVYLVVSEPLLDEVRRKLIERFGWDARKALMQMRRLALLAVRVADLPEQLPRLASDPADDHVASTAIYGRAEALVTSEKALLNDGAYEHEGQSVAVMTFDECASRIENPSFSLSQVPEILSIPTRPGLPQLDLDL